MIQDQKILITGGAGFIGAALAERLVDHNQVRLLDLGFEGSSLSLSRAWGHPNVTLLEGSGNGAFDRSAEAAVHKARRFEVPAESDIFERYFRRFTLLFRPEDLLR